MVTDSVVVFIVREGNPKGIKAWDDLTKPGVEVLTPNVHLGRRALELIAGYGAQLEQGKTDEAGARVSAFAVQRRRPGQERARVADDVASGKGDVLLGYENEAIFAKRQGQPIDYVVPDQTILIENPGRRRPRARRRRARASSSSSGRTRRRRSSATRATGRCRVGRDDLRLPDAAFALHDRGRRRLGQRPDGVLRPRERASWPGAAGARRNRPIALEASASSAPAAAAAGRRRTCRPVSR